MDYEDIVTAYVKGKLQYVAPFVLIAYISSMSWNNTPYTPTTLTARPYYRGYVLTATGLQKSRNLTNYMRKNISSMSLEWVGRWQGGWGEGGGGGGGTKKNIRVQTKKEKKVVSPDSLGGKQG